MKVINEYFSTPKSILRKAFVYIVKQLNKGKNDDSFSKFKENYQDICSDSGFYETKHIFLICRMLCDLIQQPIDDKWVIPRRCVLKYFLYQTCNNKSKCIKDEIKLFLKESM